HGYEGFPINEYTIYYRKITQEFTLGNICVGEYICKWYGTKADYVTYGAVNVNRYNTTTADPLMAVFVGRLEKDTGIMAYLEGLNILKDKFHTKLFLNICGDGSLRKTIEEYVQTNNLSVNLLGFVENPELYIRQSEYVFTSGYLGILEAMANQKIVVSVYENALKKDYLKCFPDADKLMEICDSPHELASKLNHMINNPHIKNIKTSAAFNFAAEQTWNRLADIYESLYTRTGAGQYGK
ncbi:MAG: hypothetical protein PWP07_2280, partial [Epulopiscium sp.]|nr:hypothetical protein [Candidatus Epulonipiscium sp.]